MEISSWLIIALLLVVVPTWIGNIWVCFAGLSGKVKNILFAWLSGFLTVMAASQLILVPLVLRRFQFHVYVYSICAILGMLLLISTVLFVRRIRRAIREDSYSEHMVVADSQTRESSWWILFLVGAIVLIMAQALATGLWQHIDDDDSRFVVEQNIAVESDHMYKLNLVTGELVYWDVGEMRKDMISPWAMLCALWSKLSGIAPAILCHKYLPVFLVLLCYAVYALIGMKLFKDDKEKVSIFLIFVGGLNLYGYYSTHTTQAVMLLRIWQGKAIVGALIMPAMLYIMWGIMDSYRDSRDAYITDEDVRESKLWYLLAAAGSLAGSLASGSGITLVPVLIAACGVVQLVRTGSVRHMIMMWCTALPSAVYLLCYMFFWNMAKLYY